MSDLEELERIESEKAKERQSTLNGSLPQNSAEAEKGETRDKVSEKVGIGHDTLRKAHERTFVRILTEVTVKRVRLRQRQPDSRRFWRG